MGFDVTDVAILKPSVSTMDYKPMQFLSSGLEGGLSNSGETLFLKRRDTTAEQMVDEGVEIHSILL